MRIDPRHYQLAVLSFLLLWGLAYRDFGIHPLTAVANLLMTNAVQYLFCRLNGVPYHYLSPTITGLSLSILLRSNEPWVYALAAVIAMGSKFVIRINNKHLFNPANLGIVVPVLLGMAWISPAQWGSATWSAFLFACLGGLVLNRARISDISLAFLGGYLALIFGRALWLGDPLTIPIHQMQSGALLLFAFFMISDPRTAPDHPLSRVVFALLTALLAFTLQYAFYIPEGILYALCFMMWVTPLLDRHFPAPRYRWHPA